MSCFLPLTSRKPNLHKYYFLADETRQLCFISAGNQEQTIPLSVGLPTIIIFSLLLLTFAIIIVVLLVYIMRQRKKRRSNVPAITKQLEHKALNRDASLNKKRPKSTNLEFLHATNDNRYNTAIIRGDADCFRPLVDENNHANEYVHC